LVRFYYSWKKTRSRTNERERQEKKKREGGSELGESENGTPEDSDVEEKVSLNLTNNSSFFILIEFV
jgi:hypothetical protein